MKFHWEERSELANTLTRRGAVNLAEAALMESENVLLEAVHSVLLLASGLPGARHTNAQRKATGALKLFLHTDVSSHLLI